MKDTPEFPESADIETASEDYAARFSGDVGRWMLSVQEEITYAFLGGDSRASILDVGGGHGQLARPLCERGFPVTVTGSAESCAGRIADLRKSGKCVFDLADALNLPYESNSFEHVLCFRFLTHCENWQGVAAELCRVAKASVIVDYPTSQSFNVLAPRLFSAKKKVEKNTRQWRPFRHGEIEREFRKHGFEFARRQGQFFWPMVLHRMLGCPMCSRILEWVPGQVGLTGFFGSPVIAKMVPVDD